MKEHKCPDMDCEIYQDDEGAWYTSDEYCDFIIYIKYCPFCGVKLDE